jgi:hypothetical protein
MSEALVAARNVTMGVDFPDDDGTNGGTVPSAWRHARGHFVDVKPDGFAWGALEDPRNFPSAATRRFALFRFPGVSVARIRKYLAPQLSADGKAVLRGLLWQIQWNSLPAGARTIIVNTGVLTIGGPTGDFTWTQVQTFVVNLATGLGDTADLSG